MQFNSYSFIMAFLPLVMLAYFLANRWSHPAGKAVLIAAGLVFFGYGSLFSLALLLVSMAVNYLCARLIHRGRWSRLFLALPVAVNTGLLLYFKYANFAIENYNRWFHADAALLELALPVGISFFTFQQIAWLTAVYRRELEGCSLLDYMAYILYFPKLLMGPLAEPQDFFQQLNDPARKRPQPDRIANGLKIFSLGLAKKLLLADAFAKGVNWGFQNADAATSLDWLLVTLLYTLEIYFDFSGYSDMAVGVSQMLNIDLPINFDSPYKALSIRDFWKRWHISLTRFLTKYIYIPLGGSRKGLAFTCLNTMIVFLVSGIWHGANWTFLLWGLLHGAFSVFERLFDRRLDRLFPPLRWLLTFALVNALWLLFRAESIHQWIHILKTILRFQDTGLSEELLNSVVSVDLSSLSQAIPLLVRLTRRVRGFWMLALASAGFLITVGPENNYRTLTRRNPGNMVLTALLMIVCFLCMSGESTFVYFNF